MKISACIIVKNEEKVISRCLSCLKKFADEIIVVDTGSSDSTKDIVLKFTDNIYDFKWIYDFSAARNYAFSLAKCDYVFWLDADDFISDISAEKIAAIKNEKEPFDTYMMKYAVGFDNAGKPSFEFYRERLMRNCPKARFKGFVHEAIAPFGRIKRCDITIEHRKEKEGDPRRNLNLYERHLSLGEKLDARGQYYFAKEFFFLGEYTRCEKELLKYLTMSNKFSMKRTRIFPCINVVKKRVRAILPRRFFPLCPLSDPTRKFFAISGMRKATKSVWVARRRIISVRFVPTSRKKTTVFSNNDFFISSRF